MVVLGGGRGLGGLRWNDVVMICFGISQPYLTFANSLWRALAAGQPHAALLRGDGPALPRAQASLWGLVGSHGRVIFYSIYTSCCYVTQDGGVAPGFAGERARPPHRIAAAAESGVCAARGAARGVGDDGGGGGGGGAACVTE